MHLVFRKSCRVCGSTALTPVINLGDQYLQGSFVKPGKEMPPMRKIPMSLVRCDPTIDERACGLLQMEHTVPPEILYSAYWYRSGTNNTMKNHLQTIVNKAVAIINKPSSKVLDIGCNDGTLLFFYPEKFQKYGVDPSDISQEIDKKAEDIPSGFIAKVSEAELKAAREGSPVENGDDTNGGNAEELDPDGLSPDAQDRPTEHNVIDMDRPTKEDKAKTQVSSGELAEALDSVVNKFEEEMDKAEKAD